MEHLQVINSRIQNEYCKETLQKISDVNLMEEYKNSKSVKNKVKKLENILNKCNLNDDAKKTIVNEILPEIIPAGTKSVIRGNKFNSIIKNIILEFKLDAEKFEVSFEKKCDTCITDEIPDWFILEKATGKVIIGMNQLDFTTGGHQTNRGSKYLINNKHNTEKTKFLCVICNYVQFKTLNKKFEIYKVGFANETLCYIKNIEIIVKKFFNL